MAARSQQWRQTIDKLRSLRDPELIDWLCQQVDVARNIERGIQDRRPRKDGPTFLIMLEFVANQKRKALAVLHWFKGAEEHGRLTTSSKTLTDGLVEMRNTKPRRY